MYYRLWGSFMKGKNILFFGLFLGLIWIGLSNINKSTENLDIDRVKNSLDTALISCYSVEGHYPENFQYLKKYYGFTYDINSYFITYDWQGIIYIQIFMFIERGMNDEKCRCFLFSFVNVIVCVMLFHAFEYSN